MGERAVTAPFLLHNALRFTPSTPPFERARECAHEYVTSPLRSTLPQLDERAATGTVWQTQSVCLRCHSHLTVRIAFKATVKPCPNADYPLHHFRIVASRVDDPRMQLWEFQCGAPDCGAEVNLETRAPVLSTEEIHLLVDSTALQRRADQMSAMRDNEPVQASSAYEALSVLSSYARDAVAQSDGECKRIPEHNKRFLLALGQDLNPLLKRLGFEYEKSTDSTALNHWRLPIVTSPINAEPRLALENLSDELRSLILRRPESERAAARDPLPQQVRSDRDFERVLGCLSYPRCPAIHTAIPAHLENAFNHLGALPDFDDELILFAFERNAAWDLKAANETLQSLRRIAEFRGTEALHTRVAIVESTAPPSRAEVDRAYQYFDVHPDRGAMMTDEQLLAKFHTMSSDLGVVARQSARNQLSVLARGRGSSTLQNAANQRLETYEDALTFLGADKTTLDEFVIALATAKESEAPGNQQLVQQAVSLIADARNSESLRLHAQRDPGNNTMSLSAARALLGIAETDDPDDDGISACHGVAVSENSYRAAEYNEALSVIAEHRNSDALRKYLNDSKSQFQQATVTRTSSPADPRGLNNIGNTCYLNSLLQYLYTIRPLREMLKNFDSYRQSLGDDIEPFVKKVSGMQATKSDVRKALEFVEELNKLFRLLEVTHQSAATPEVNLARLTIGEPKISDPLSPVTARRNTLSSPRTSDAFTPLRAFSSRDKAASSKNSTFQSELIDLSDGTKAPVPADGDKDVMQLDPSHSEITAEASASGSTDGPEDSKLGSNANADQVISDANPPAEAPIDPKPTQEIKRETEEWARQQDINDALENVIRQLQWAIKPESVSATGDQVDLISKLFWGICRDISIRGQKESFEQLDFKDIFVSVEEGPIDLNEALANDFFGLDRPSEELAKYTTIKQLPDILHIVVGRAKNLADGSWVRNTNQLRLHREIFMDRFMDDDDMKQRRKLEFKYKQTLRQLKTSYDLLESTPLGVSASNLLRAANQHLMSVESKAEELGLDLGAESTDLSKVFAAEADHAEARIAEVKKTMEPLQEKLKSLDPSGGALKYCIQAVFVHMGASLNAGHWFILIYDHRADIWRKYNDDHVDIIDAADVERTIFSPDESSRGASAFLSYVREDKRDDIFETVARNPEPTEPIEAALLPQEHTIQDDHKEVVELADQAAPAPPVPARRPSWDREQRINDNLTSW